MDTEYYNILYVDDELNSLSAFKNLFRKKFNIIPANSAKEGIKILESQHINLIITDQRMPEMTGIEFLKKVKKKWPDLKCVLLTAFTEIEVIKEAINEVGIYWYMNKPFDPDQMEQSINKAIEADRVDVLLKESEEKFRGVFESMTDVFSRSDMDGKCMMISPSVYRILGYTSEEILGKNLTDYYTNPSQRSQMLNKLEKSKGIDNFELELISKNGDFVTVSANVRMYFSSAGEPLGLESSFRDVTEQKKAEEGLLISEKRKSLLIHDIGERLKELTCLYSISNSIKNREALEEVFQDIVDAIPPGWHYPEITVGKLRFNNQEWVSEPFEETAWKLSSNIIIDGQKLGVVEVYYIEECPIIDEGPFMMEERKLLNSITETLTEAIERKQAEEKLQDSEEKFSKAFNDSPIGQTIINAKTWKRIAVNNKFREIFGFTNDEVLDIDIKKNPLAVNLEMLKNGMELVLKQGQLKDYPLDMYHSSGQIRNVLINATKTSHIDSHIDNELFIVSYIDITESKQAGEKLKNSEEKYRTLIENIPDVTWTSDNKGNTIFISTNIQDIYGYSSEEIYTQSEIIWFGRIHHEDVENIKNAYTALFEIGSPYNVEYRIKTKNGAWIWVHDRSITTYQKEGVLYADGVLIDITDSKITEQKILKHQERLKDLANKLVISEEVVRKQIAIDLHDDVGQLLSSSRMQLTRVLDLEENPDIRIRLKSISKALLKSIQATREAIFNLSPPQLDEIGLYATVENWMKEEIEMKHDIRTSISGEEKAGFNMEENAKILVFRSIKELMINVVKHGQANHLKVAFKRKRKLLEITVQDDGVGFDYNPDLFKQKSDSYGIFSIQERLSDLGGSMTIDSVINKGTKVKLSVPIKDKE